jgi:CheY-like chemotaxis protein
MFDLPSMLGEYLLPLLILVPLAVVVVLVVTRQQKEEPWQQRRAEPMPPPAPRPLPPVARRAEPEETPRSPIAYAPTEPAALDMRGYAPTEPAPLGPPTAYAPTEPAPLGPATPFVAAIDIAAPAVAEQATPPLQRRRASDALPSPAAPNGGPLPLLIVDDSAVVRAKLSKLLTGAGYAVTLARHGQEALEQLNQHWFAMMITDLEMPEMDGFELIAEVSNDIRTENLPIIAITGHEALHAKVQDARGLFGIFKKPWNDRELLARVEVLSRLRPRS